MKTLHRFFVFFLLILIFVAIASEAGGEQEATGFMEPFSKTEGKDVHERGAQILGLLLMTVVSNRSAYGSSASPATERYHGAYVKQSSRYSA